MILWCKLGTRASQTLKVLHKRKPPEVGDRFSVLDPRVPGAIPVTVRCVKIKLFDGQPLYYLEH